MNNSISIRDRISAFRDELRERREARVAYETLKQELASYQTAREVDDLLGVIANQDGPDAQRIRDLLLENRRPATTLYRAA